MLCACRPLRKHWPKGCKYSMDGASSALSWDGARVCSCSLPVRREALTVDAVICTLPLGVLQVCSSCLRRCDDSDQQARLDTCAVICAL